jgi:hypothetical protein
VALSHDGANSPARIAFDGQGVSSSLAVSFSRGWNLLSLPFMPENTNVDIVFPTAVSNAFEFAQEVGYARAMSVTEGKGYWLKFSPSSTVGGPGKIFSRECCLLLLIMIGKLV